MQVIATDFNACLCSVQDNTKHYKTMNISEAFLGPCHVFNTKPFAKIVNKIYQLLPRTNTCISYYLSCCQFWENTITIIRLELLALLFFYALTRYYKMAKKRSKAYWTNYSRIEQIQVVEASLQKNSSKKAFNQPYQWQVLFVRI